MRLFVDLAADTVVRRVVENSARMLGYREWALYER
jgi:hypothetical protein